MSTTYTYKVKDSEVTIEVTLDVIKGSRYSCQGDSDECRLLDKAMSSTYGPYGNRVSRISAPGDIAYALGVIYGQRLIKPEVEPPVDPLVAGRLP